MQTLIRATTLASALAAVGCFPTAASAQNVSPSMLACPARYELLSGSCYNATNGDVVLAETKVATPNFARAQCRPGYEIMVNALCVNSKTGDVVYADIVTGIQTANK